MKAAMQNAVDRIRTLEEEHRLLDQRLRHLVRRAYLTPDEQREATAIRQKKSNAT